MSDKATGWIMLGTVFLLTVTAYMQYMMMQEQDLRIAALYSKFEGLETAGNSTTTKKDGE